jgi:sugar-phosphatase
MTFALRAAIFDMDGLLIDSEPLWRQAEIEVFGTVGVELTDELCSQTTGLRMDAAVQHWFERHPWTSKSPGRVEDEVKARVVDLVLDRAEPLPGVHEAVAFFRKRGVPVAVCSSSSRAIIAAVLRKLGLDDDRVEVVHSGEDEALGKPHPAAYLTTAALLGIPAHHCVAFEDSMNGMISAKAARMKVVAVPAPEFHGQTRWHFCDAQIRSLREVDAALWDKLARQVLPAPAAPASRHRSRNRQTNFSPDHTASMAATLTSTSPAASPASRTPVSVRVVATPDDLFGHDSQRMPSFRRLAFSAGRSRSSAASSVEK